MLSRSNVLSLAFFLLKLTRSAAVMAHKEW